MFATALLAMLLSTSAYANSLCSELFNDQAKHQKGVFDAHASIAADLYTGRITSVRRFKENDNRNLLFLVTIEAKNPYSGRLRHREAFLKPSIWGDSNGFARAGMEFFAYPFNRLLDMDYVPPAAYRRDLSIDSGGIHLTQGALIFKASEYTPMAAFDQRRYPSADADYHDAVVSDHRILAVLLQNGDGHYWNMGHAKHWVDGKIRPAFIDWGASLRPGTNATVANYKPYGEGNTDPVTRVRVQTLAALKRLTFEDLERYIGEFISKDEAHGIMANRNAIVSYFENLIAEKGADAVLIRF